MLELPRRRKLSSEPTTLSPPRTKTKLGLPPRPAQNHQQIEEEASRSEPHFFQAEATTTIHLKNRTTKTRVRFSHVDILEFPIQLGDNPTVPCRTPPVSIAFSPLQDCARFSIDILETHRPAPRRHGSELLLSKQQRIYLLKQAGHSDAEIETAAMEALYIKRQRVETLHDEGLLEGILEKKRRARLRKAAQKAAAASSDGCEQTAVRAPVSAAIPQTILQVAAV